MTVSPNYRGNYKIGFPVSMFSAIEDIDEYELGKVLKMLFIYSMNDKQLTYRYQQMFEFFNADPRVRSIFKIFKPYIDPQIEKYKKTCERNAKNGRKGGRPRKDGSPAISRDDTLYQKREILEEMLRAIDIKIEEPTKEVVEVAPMQPPYYYDNYNSMTSTSFFDVCNL